MSVDSKMTALADLIRGLRGVSGKMGLDAMAGHLQDEQDGLDSALAALEEKGVTVPSGTKVDGLAALIAAIEAGGGGTGVQVVSGTFTPAEEIVLTYSDPYLLEHNSGFTPKMYIFWKAAGSSGTTVTKFAAILGLSKPTSAGTKTLFRISAGVSTSSSRNDAQISTESKSTAGVYSTITDSNYNSQYVPLFSSCKTTSQTSRLLAGETYCWLTFSDWEGEF